MALRAALKQGTTPEIEGRIAAAPLLLTSRLSWVESARALLRVKQGGDVAEGRIADAQRQLNTLWSRCEIWELSPSVCELASSVLPNKMLRTLDALHLATFLLARRRIEGFELLTADERLLDATL